MSPGSGAGSASETDAKPRKWTLGRGLLYAVHWGIIVNFATQCLYAGYMVFYVLKPEGVDGPLWDKAKEIPIELMVPRRLYATEFWIAFAGLAIYLALTEIGPRLARYRK